MACYGFVAIPVGKKYPECKYLYVVDSDIFPENFSQVKHFALNKITVIFKCSGFKEEINIYTRA